VLLAVGAILLLASVELGRAVATQPPADELPPIIKSGLVAYKSEGPEAAIKAWLKGSPLEGNRDALTQVNMLRQIQDYYGSYQSFDAISSHNLTPNTQIVYFAMNYEKGPVFGKFLIYHGADGWVMVSFTFNTKPELILPNS